MFVCVHKISNTFTKTINSREVKRKRPKIMRIYRENIPFAALIQQRMHDSYDSYWNSWRVAYQIYQNQLELSNILQQSNYNNAR